MAFVRCVWLACFALVHGAEDRSAQNPVRKVVSLLQAMQKTVQEEGAKEAELFENFMCYCKNGRGDLSASIDAAEQKAPAVASSIEAAEAKLSGAKSTLKQAQADRTAAKAAMSEATAIRKKEAAAFASVKADSEANIAAIAKATAAISAGVAGNFLQTPAAQVLRRSVSSILVGPDQEEMLSFLAQGSAYAPQSGEIIGILKGMGDTMGANLADATASEKDGISNFEGLMADKKEEVGLLTGKIETKTEQIGELSVSIAQQQNDLADTQDALAQDQKFLAQLEKGCATKASEWEERQKTRSDELVALADTIKVLNDDDALELFKKTLPSASASFVQVQQGMSAVRVKALAVLSSARGFAAVQEKSGLEAVMLALSDSSGGFGKVVQMIDDLVKLLGQEQTDDENKKEYCNAQFDQSEDKKKALDNRVADADAAIANAKESIATFSQEIASLEAGIGALDKSVAEATAQRKDENTEYKALVAADSAAQEVLAFAKNRLNRFYNPKLYKPPPTVELSRGERIASNFGGQISTTAPGGIAGTGITVFAQISMHAESNEAPGPPPDTFGAYTSKSDENNGVIAMIDLLIKDLQKEMTEAETQEMDSQAEYEQLMQDSAEKRTVDSKSLTEKDAAKADMQSSLQAHEQARAEGAHEVMLTARYISSLHGECDWLLQYFDARKAARAGEVESLNRAKAVLSGADYSLLQATKSHGFLRGH